MLHNDFDKNPSSKIVEKFEARKMSNFFANRIIPYSDGDLRGFDYYLEPSMFIRFTGVREYENHKNKLPLYQMLGLPEHASMEQFDEMINFTTNRQRVIEGFQSKDRSICLTEAQQQTFDEVVLQGKYKADNVEIFLWPTRHPVPLRVQPADLDDAAYELWLDVAAENQVGYFINYKQDIDVYKEARFDFDVKLDRLEMDPNFENRRMNIKLFKRQFNAQVPIPVQHVRKKFTVATVVLISSLVVGAVGHSIMMTAPGILGKVVGATIKAVGALGALLGRQGYKTLIADFDDRPVILKNADNML